MPNVILILSVFLPYICTGSEQMGQKNASGQGYRHRSGVKAKQIILAHLSLDLGSSLLD